MRTFDDIIPPSRRSGSPNDPFSAHPEPPRRPPPSPRRGRFPYAIVLIAVLVVGASALVLVYFSGAKIEITPTVALVQVNASMSAGPAGEVPYNLLSAKKTATVSVPSTGTKQASDKAQGTITIYNTGGKLQALIAQTRFATPAGLIYKIQKSVVVPAGTNDKPGTVTATVVAAESGSNYDIGPSSFTIPGLAGTPQATAVYGRSTAPITGGATGSVPVVDSSVETQAVANLENSLTKDLAAGLDVPRGYTLITGAATTTFHELAPVASASAGKADIVVEATITGVAFPTDALAGAIASSTTAMAGATLGDGTALTLTPTSGFPSNEGDAFSFTLSGSASLVSKIDRGTIATAVAGKSRNEAQTALANYPEIKRAVLVLRPFWKSHFPEDPAAITVVTLLPAP